MSCVQVPNWNTFRHTLSTLYFHPFNLHSFDRHFLCTNFPTHTLSTASIFFHHFDTLTLILILQTELSYYLWIWMDFHTLAARIWLVPCPNGCFRRSGEIYCLPAKDVDDHRAGTWRHIFFMKAYIHPLCDDTHPSWHPNTPAPWSRRHPPFSGTWHLEHNTWHSHPFNTFPHVMLNTTFVHSSQCVLWNWSLVPMVKAYAQQKLPDKTSLVIKMITHCIYHC